MATSVLTDLLKELRTLSAEDRKALADVLTNAPQQKAEELAQNPCDVSHVWSDTRTNALGKKVARSCKACGVLQLNTGAAHGVHEDDLPEAVSPATDTPSDDSEEQTATPPPASAKKKKKSA